MGYSAGTKFIIIGFKYIKFYSQLVPLIIVMSVVGVIGSGLANLSLNWILAQQDKLAVYKFLSLVIVVIGLALFPLSVWGASEASFLLYAALLLCIGIAASPSQVIDG